MITRLSKRMKKALAVNLAACVMFSVFSTTMNSEAASGKTTVYVVSKISEKGDTDSYLEFKYNSKGLLVETRHPNPSYSENGSGTVDSINKFSYNKANKIKKIEYIAGYDATKDVTVIKYKKGNVVSKKTKTAPDGKKYKALNSVKSFKYDSDDKLKSTSAFSYTYDKKGRIKAITSSTDAKTKRTYSYDKKGYVKSYLDISNNPEGVSKKTVKFKNSYKSGRLVKRNNYKISYKKISIPKSSKELVEKQQRSIIEDFTANDGYNDSYMPGLDIAISWGHYNF